MEDIRQLSAAMTTYTNKVSTNITVTETETSSNSDLPGVEKKEPTEVNPFSAVASAALLIQKAVRGRQGRIAFKQKMEGMMSIQSPTMSIHDAAKKGKVEEVKANLAAGVNIDEKDDVSKRMSS